MVGTPKTGEGSVKTPVKHQTSKDSNASRLIDKLISQKCTTDGNDTSAKRKSTRLKSMSVLDYADQTTGPGPVEGSLTDDAESKKSVIRQSADGSYNPNGEEEPIGEFPPKVRVELESKFRPGIVKQLIEDTIAETLQNKEYSAEEAKSWTTVITDQILQKTKELKFDRYKFIVSVILGERRSQGVSSAYRCLWDAESDCGASFTFTNDSVYCTAMVFGIYYY